MNILDENVPESQRRLLKSSRVSIRQHGYDIGRKGMKDDDIIPLLHHLDRPTFFTLDSDFYDRGLCHEGYCLVHLDIDEDSVAEHVRRLLRHREFDSKTKRMGRVIRVSPTKLSVWRIHGDQERHLSWH